MTVSGARACALLEKLNFIRPYGEPGEKKAASILEHEALTAGADTVTVEEFPVSLSHVSSSLSVTEPFYMDCGVCSERFCGDTPAEGIDVPFVYTDILDTQNLRSFAGKAVLANEVHADTKAIADAGIACLLSCIGKANEEPDLVDFLIRSEDSRGLLPILFVRTSDAVRMVKEGASRVHITVRNEPFETSSQNVIAELKGNEDIITFGAHYDSVLAGPGISDNGGGTVILMELLRYFAANRVTQTLRFIWFGGEEEGYCGSKAYLERHRSELPACKLMMNVDVAGCVIGRNFIRCTCDEAVAHAMQFLADEFGYPADIKQGFCGSDSTPFARMGVPAIGFGRSVGSGLEFCHTRFDTIDWISPAALESTAAFMAYYADRVLHAARFPIPQQIPEDIAAKAKERMDGWGE